DWSPTTGLSNSHSGTTRAQPAQDVTYRIVGSDKVGCFSDTGFVAIKVYANPTVDAGEDTTINVGQAYTTHPILSSDITDVKWLPDYGIIGSTSAQGGIVVKPKQTTTYRIAVQNPGGCKSDDEITIFVVCNGSNLFIPNTFSPNGDGKNDVFYPRGTGLSAIKTMRIFNRWGEQVFQKANINSNSITGSLQFILKKPAY
ncbi:MAG: gliding motility-associated C-terminal domain-containing protein, partial [Sphingobacteriales bacterium]|nr:gliding motility-associated C-terminal domain-containing protein [Sphingobacteriales bacterium]